MLELCDRLGAGILVHHSGAAQLAPGENAADLDKMERDALAEMAEIAKGYGVRIALENIFTTESGQYRQAPSQVAETVRAIGSSNVIALIDFSHAYIEATHRGLDFRDELRAMADTLLRAHAAGTETAENLADSGAELARIVPQLLDHLDRLEAARTSETPAA